MTATDAVFLSGYRAGWAARDAALLTELNRRAWKATEAAAVDDEPVADSTPDTAA